MGGGARASFQSQRPSGSRASYPSFESRRPHRVVSAFCTSVTRGKAVRGGCLTCLMPPGREVATGVGPGLGHLHPSTARVRVNSHRAPGLRLVQKAPTLAGEACEQRVLRAAEASREDGSRCWVSVGITEFSGHLEPVRLGGVIYATSALTAGCLIPAAPRGSRYQPWLARPGRAMGAAGVGGRAGRRRTVFGITSGQAEQRSGKKMHSTWATPSSPPRPVLTSHESRRLATAPSLCFLICEVGVLWPSLKRFWGEA